MQGTREAKSVLTRPGDFHRQVTAFCNLVAGHRRLPLRHFLRSVHQSLPSLYSAALALPDVSPDREPSYPKVTVKEWRRLYRGLDARLGQRTWYHEVFDAYDRKDRQALIGYLADDLADVHADLANGLRCWRTGDHENATWYWRFMRDAHWGEHATSAIRALYWLQRNTKYGPVPAMPNKRIQRTHSRVTPRAERLHGSRRAARR